MILFLNFKEIAPPMVVNNERNKGTKMEAQSAAKMEEYFFFFLQILSKTYKFEPLKNWMRTHNSKILQLTYSFKPNILVELGGTHHKKCETQPRVS